MGLDMYLEKSIYVGAIYDYKNVRGTIDITIAGEPLKVNFNKVVSIVERAGYWRKANQIHGWFVNNVQYGEDNCARYFVSHDNLRDLLDLCKQVQSNHELAEELLPCNPGFFYGGYEYDEWYFEQIDDTIKIIEELASEPDFEMVDFYYQASW